MTNSGRPSRRGPSARSRCCPTRLGRGVRRAVEAQDLGQRAAVRAAGVGVDEDLGLAVGVEVDDLQRRVALARGGEGAAGLPPRTGCRRRSASRRRPARPARVTTRCGSLLPYCAAAQVKVACTAPADAVAVPPSAAPAAPGASSASASASAPPASAGLRRRRALIGPRRRAGLARPSRAAWRPPWPTARRTRPASAPPPRSARARAWPGTSAPTVP